MYNDLPSWRWPGIMSDSQLHNNTMITALASPSVHTRGTRADASASGRVSGALGLAFFGEEILRPSPVCCRPPNTSLPDPTARRGNTTLPPLHPLRPTRRLAMYYNDFLRRLKDSYRKAPSLVYYSDVRRIYHWRREFNMPSEPLLTGMSIDSFQSAG